MPVYLEEAVAQRKKKDSLKQEIEPVDLRKSRYAQQVKDWTSGRPLEESGLVQLSGERLADVVKMAEPARAYGEIFSERSKEKDVFGREGKGWGFPILNKVRGKVQAHRYEKALRKGDIKVWATPEESQQEHIRMKYGEYPTYEQSLHKTGGEYAKKGWTRSKSDADLFMAVGRSLDDVLTTFIHEGAHMEPLIGKQVGHGRAIKTKKELGGWKRAGELTREGKAFFIGHKDGEEMYERLYSSQGTFDKAIEHRAHTALKDGRDIAKTEALRDHLALLKFQSITGEEVSSMGEAEKYKKEFYAEGKSRFKDLGHESSDEEWDAHREWQDKYSKLFYFDRVSKKPRRRHN